MSRLISIETDADREQLVWLRNQLVAASDSVPGWMATEARVDAVIDRIDRALDAYDRMVERLGERDVDGAATVAADPGPLTSGRA